MAVTLTGLDLMQPLGELDASLFAATDDSGLLLTGWLRDAIDQVASVAASGQNAAAAAWVYYRAFTLFAQRAANKPSTITVDGVVTRTTASDQRKYFDDRAKYWQGEFARLSTTTPTAASAVFFGRVRARPDVNSVRI